MHREFFVNLTAVCQSNSPDAFFYSRIAVYSRPRFMNRLSVFIGALLFAPGLINEAKAQEKKGVPIVAMPHTDTLALKKDTVPQRDIYDVLERGLLKKKPKSGKKDTVSTKPAISFIPAVGYTLTSGLAVTFSGNMAFRTAPGARISTITASAAFTQKKQFTVPIESNIWSKSGKYIFIGDYRFYKYPQDTYGLGSSSNINNVDPVQFNYIRFYETVMRRITGNLYLGGGYIIDYHGDISESGNTNGTPSDYAAYGTPTHTISSGITFNGFYDSRDNSINPAKGSYTAFQYRDSFDFLGSTSPWSSLIIDVRRYYNLPEGSDNVLVLWNYDWLVLKGKPPYLDLPATSWDPYSSTGRGYIQGRFRGAQMVYLESEYRYKISADGLFGGVVFVNAESFSAANGTRLQGIQPGIGPGLRIKLNKVSKTNLCIDYGFGRESSRGLFVNVGELF